MKKNLIVSTALALLLFACNKNDDGDDNAPSASRRDILTNGSWKITAMVEDGDGNGSYETDVLVTLPSCFRDNFYTFKTNGDFEMDEGPTKCDPADPQTDMTTWLLLDNNTKLEIDSDEYQIDLINNTTVRLKDDFLTYGTMLTLTKR